MIIVAFLAAVAVLCTLRGADRARSPLDARAYVSETLALALEQGNRSSGVLSRLQHLRAELGRRPLDSETRVQYAALLQAMTRSPADTRAAAFHARAAADLSPVTFPVVELAALILARSGDRAESLALLRGAFEYEPAAAAELLLRMETRYLGGVVAEEALADTPGAWSAWARILARNERRDEAYALLERATLRWPDDLELLVGLSRFAAQRSDWDSLERWVLRVDPIPLEPRGLELTLFRARLHAERGRRAKAEEDLDAVYAVAADKPYVLTFVGDVAQRLGAMDLARRSWNQALFLLSGDHRSLRVSIHLRLGELEEREGRASVALRHWRSVLELQPDHPRARKRVAELTGFQG